jgi:prepilin-type N-terminal cleavage/methylation domain-containing protein
MKKSVQAFTLVELMVVIALIVLLMAMVGSGLWKARQKAQITRAKVDMRAMEQAIRSFKAEYEKWPGDPDGLQTNSTWRNNNYQLVKYLVSSNPVLPYTVLNKRQRAFWEMDGTNVTFYDGWGSPYSITVDPTNSTVSLISAGPDKNINTLGDNVSYIGN